jgi:hypothetical protein
VELLDYSMVAEVASIDDGDTSPELGFRALREIERKKRLGGGGGFLGFPAAADIVL